MKKIDIILIKELFLLRYYKRYSKQVMQDFCDYIDSKLSSSGYLGTYLPCHSYKDFINDFEQNMLSCNPKDFIIRKHFKEYLAKYQRFIYAEKF